MNWTKILPTAPGWYWFRYGASSDPQCVYVIDIGPKKSPLRVSMTGIAKPISLETLSTGDWFGPIAEPASEGT